MRPGNRLPSPRARPTRRRAAAAVLLALVFGGGVLAGCSGGRGDGKQSAAEASGATPTSDVAGATSAATPFAVASPQTLPVTPVHIDYVAADPSFEALPGARAIFGRYDGGAYQIEVPDAWNGDVVYFAHGFRGNPPELTVTPPPIREYLVARGYAWAASSYSKNGYEPGAGARDTYALRDIFAQKVGRPKHQYLYGQSMGGHVVTFSLEQYPDAYDGALTECGVVSGHEVLDYFLSWGALAGYFSGVDLENMTTDAGAFGTTIQSRILPALGDAPDALTAKGRAFEDVIENLTGGPRPFFREGFAANFGFNFVILVNAVGAAGPSNAAADNTTARYRIDDGYGATSAQVNAGVPRVAANPAYRDPAAYPEFAPMTGKIDRPLLTLHDTGDLFVPIALEQSYRRTVEAAGRGDLLVQRAVRRAGHCNFSEQERERAFDDLVRWVQTGAKPAGDDLSGDLRDVGTRFTDPPEPADPGGVTP